MHIQWTLGWLSSQFNRGQFFEFLYLQHSPSVYNFSNSGYFQAWNWADVENNFTKYKIR